jgi:hypothetical protein
MLPSLNLPPVDLRMKEQGGQTFVFDRVRKIYVLLTPEEWVRQNLLGFLIDHKKFPEGLTEVEKSIRLFNTDKRVDILVRKKDLTPLLLVECKAPSVTLRQDQADQLARYQVALKAPYCMLSNGNQHVIMEFDGDGLRFVKNLPAYDQTEV